MDGQPWVTCVFIKKAIAEIDYCTSQYGLIRAHIHTHVYIYIYVSVYM